LRRCLARLQRGNNSKKGMRMTKAVLVLSGGIDSTVMAHHLIQAGNEPCLGISFMYGQRHLRELTNAAAVCYGLGIHHQIADLTNVSHLFSGSSALTNHSLPVPDGHYEDASMRSTVVPNRNMIMLSIAIGYAIAQGASMVAYGAHRGDHEIYPDCRSSFVDAMRSAAALADWAPVALVAPFIAWSKAEIVARGQQLGVDFAKTWSCYRGGGLHCGTCGTCSERKEAFALCNLTDPVEYAA
jgi:7-cyano-7-deazaguanine synthase